MRGRGHGQRQKDGVPSPLVFDVYRSAGEWWLDFDKGITVDGGLCAIKMACATSRNCDGFVYRVRDGAGILGQNFETFVAGSKMHNSKKGKFGRKCPRGVLLYVKKEKTVKVGARPFETAAATCAPPLTPLDPSPGRTTAQGSKGLHPGAPSRY